MVDLTPEKVFALHSEIRFAAFGNVTGKQFFEEMRPNVKGLFPSGEFRLLARLRSEYLAEMSKRMAAQAREVKYILTGFNTNGELILLKDDRFLVVSFSKTVPIKEILGLVEPLKDLLSQA